MKEFERIFWIVLDSVGIGSSRMRRNMATWAETRLGTSRNRVR